MGNFESQKYRDDLAEEIKQEPSKEKRREILSTAKLTEEYREAKKLREKEADFEVLKIPEIFVREEREAQLLSFILKAKNPEWGNDDTPLSVDVKKYFSENPLSFEVSEFLDEIRALQQKIFDE